MNGRMTITDVAEQVGVTPKTLIRWEKTGKIKKPKRDFKGWRTYAKEDVDAIQRLIDSVYEV